MFLSVPKSGKRFRSSQEQGLLYISYTWGRDWNAYQVRIGKIANLCFSWELYGSEGKALKAAKRFRDSLLPLLEVAGKNYRGNLASSRNTSGNVGITAEIMKGRYPCYSAQWTDKNGKRVKKSFSVTKWGEEKARQLAIEAREHGTGMYPSEVLKEIAELKEKVKKKQTKMKAQSATRD